MGLRVNSSTAERGPNLNMAAVPTARKRHGVRQPAAPNLLVARQSGEFARKRTSKNIMYWHIYTFVPVHILVSYNLRARLIKENIYEVSRHRQILETTLITYTDQESPVKILRFSCEDKCVGYDIGIIV
ncbi:hypothetical protein EVAR_46890_1 [Eumeta japonica]|uniref:Uncharacterized protein n=1 Tax=Eumeta variegata TaxID=151549 RepID=A0A4C1YFE0_EUMVA|nr:hypothetical protein EVAR_46890_1 [Eumeta japonica]